MVLSMRESGIMICSMDREKRYGLMNQVMLGITLMEKKMDSVISRAEEIIMLANS